jgi:hypothetical protein
MGNRPEDLTRKIEEEEANRHNCLRDRKIFL